VLLVRDARRWLGHEGFDAHRLHQPAASFPTDPDAGVAEFDDDFARSVERELCVDPVDLLHDGFVALDPLRLAGREPIAVHGEKLALLAH
jgi:hypothetical protein